MNQPVPAPAPQRRVKRNRYDSLRAPECGRWTPELTVSVVVPAYGAQHELDVTLAALAAQTYPPHLLDVIVVDDGSEPPLRMPELRPERTRFIGNHEGAWGVASAVDAGIATAEGPIILRLDSDILPDRTHVEAHARWHHTADYCVVIGNLGFVEIDADDLDLEQVRAAVEADTVETLFGDRGTGQSWEVALLERSDRLLDDELRAYTVTNGATISFTKALYDRSGGMDTDLKLGSDTELGYRQAQAGAVFIPDAGARAWHLGLSQLQSRRDEGKRYRQPFVANRVPTLRHLRTHPGIAWTVPYVEVVIDASEVSFEMATASAASVLADNAEARVALVGPWSTLKDGRVRPLDDPQLDLRLIREVFSGDPRVSYVESVAATAAPAPFRLTLAPGTVLRPNGLGEVLALADRERVGRVKCLSAAQQGERPCAVLDRTAALARALQTRRPDEDLDTAVEESWGLWWADGTAWFADWEEPVEAPSQLLHRVGSLEASIKRLEAKEDELRRRVSRWNKTGNAARNEAKDWERAARDWQQAADEWRRYDGGKKSFAQRAKGRLRRMLGE
ncbi:hypothetical protein GCM10010403_41400 [Glycomyces rutgersensis]|uniref:Glycosyltransferase 2-like domain-containing protein n=1 Tax=Glycomyces rutgersensis TaxID=58115 RepID=A0ABN3G537_9ACTN